MTNLARLALPTLAMFLLLPLTEASGATRTTTRVSVSSSETEGNGSSGQPAISADGRFVAFTSRASDLVDGDTNGQSDVFVRDRANGTTSRVSVSTGGTEGNGDSYNPAISSDGRFVAFASEASNLIATDANGRSDIFLRDRANGTTVRVSVTSSGAEGNGDSDEAAITPDGRFVAFESFATNLNASGDTNGAGDVFLRDRSRKTTVRVSVSYRGDQANERSHAPDVTPDGRFVAFDSFATNLTASADTNGAPDVFLRDRAAKKTVRVSVTHSGKQANEASWDPDVTPDGRFVAFWSHAANLNAAGDANGWPDVFVRDRSEKTTLRVSISTNGAAANGFSNDPSISRDGRFVAFRSSASSLNEAGDTNNVEDAFLRDRAEKITRRISISSAGDQANSLSDSPVVSADGSFVAFLSYADNLVSGDTNDHPDVFVRGPFS